jgi:hypothetical protein
MCVWYGMVWYGMLCCALVGGNEDVNGTRGGM